MMAFTGAFVLVTTCGTVLASPANPIFLQVDINGGNGPTQTNFQGWNFSNPPGNLWTANFSPSSFLFTNSLTPTGAVTVTIFATNYLTAEPPGTNFTAPSWYSPTNSPAAINRGSMGGEATANLYNDCLSVYHNVNIGQGWDVISLTFSNLSPNTNYEITVWNYDPTQGGTTYYEAWGIVNPTNYPNYAPAPGGGGGENRPPTLARVSKGGTWPSQAAPNNPLYAYSGSFFVTTDSNGSATVYGWEDDDSWGGSQDVLLNGFGIGFATIVGPSTNAVTTVLNPVPASYGPPTVWPYTAGIAIGTDGSYTDEPFGTNTILGESFLATRDFRLRNFYIACNGTADSGDYTLLLYDLGVGSPPASFDPAAYTNLLSHPQLAQPEYWSFSPAGLTNKTIVKFKFASGDQPTLVNGHYYFLGFQYAGGGSNDMVWDRTTSGTTYAHGTAYRGSPTNVNNNLGSLRNFIMAIDLLNPNLAVSVTNAPLASSWPGSPVIQYSNPPAAPSYENPTLYVPEGIGSGRALSMSFIATSDFNFGGVALFSRGLGSSNCLFTLAVYDVTNTFFTVTDTIEKWPRNFEPRWDTDPKGIPIFGTNLDFYYTSDNGANGAGHGTNDQFLILTVNNPAYQVPIISNHNYVVELTADTLGQNANTDGLFQWIRDTGQGDFQIELFPDVGQGDGFRTNAASGGSSYLVLPRGLSRIYTDPEQYAGMVAGNVRYLLMAVYAAPPVPPQPPYNITGQSVGAGGFTITWNSVIGRGYSVVRRTNLNDASWTILATNYPPTGATSTTTSFTDTGAGPGQSFYRVTSP